MTFTEAVGALVKAVRGNRTQTQLAKDSGVIQSTISAIEIGNRKFASDHIEKILAATKTPGMAAIRLLLSQAEKLEKEPAPTRERRARRVPVDERVAAAEAKVKRALGEAAARPAATKQARTPRTRR